MRKLKRKRREKERRKFKYYKTLGRRNEVPVSSKVVNFILLVLL